MVAEEVSEVLRPQSIDMYIDSRGQKLFSPHFTPHLPLQKVSHQFTILSRGRVAAVSPKG